MKNKLSILTTLGIVFLILGLIFSAFPIQGYAEDLEIIGKDIGLVVKPADRRLFDLNNLNPGDMETARLVIKNNYKHPFNLYMRAERIGDIPKEGEADLLDVLIVNINLRGKQIYKGPIKDFAVSSISLGKINPGDVHTLIAKVSLLGPETGDEYQGKSAEVQWIFIAESVRPPSKPGDRPKIIDSVEHKLKEESEKIIDKPEIIEDIEEREAEEQEDEAIEDETILPQPRPRMPKTGEASSHIFYIMGSTMIFLGAYIDKKYR